MSEVKVSKDIQEMFKKMDKENKVDDIIRSNYTLANALSAMYYFNKFENDLCKIGIGIVEETDFGNGLGWLAEIIKTELMEEFDMPKEVFETDAYLDIIYDTYLTDGAFIHELARYINWLQENNPTPKAD